MTIEKVCAALREQLAESLELAPIVRGALWSARLYDAMHEMIEPRLGNAYVVDTIRAYVGPRVRPAHPPLFETPSPVAAMRVALRVEDASWHLAEVCAALHLDAGTYVEWLFAQRWFVDRVTDPNVPALRVTVEDPPPFALQNLFARVAAKRQRGAHRERAP